VSGHALHLKLDGRTYSGTFAVDRKVLTITTSYGKRSAEIGAKVSHHVLAEQLLRDLERRGAKALRFASCRKCRAPPPPLCRSADRLSLL
jgi:hypothetical protein